MSAESGEFWDLTDAEGNRLGMTHARSDPNLPAGAFHVVAATWAVRPDGAVLVAQRAANKTYPLQWEFPAGSALAGESSRVAAARELGEEAGIRIHPGRLVPVGRSRERIELVDIYVVHLDAPVEPVPQPEEVAFAEWVSLDEVDRRRREKLFARPWIHRLDLFWTDLVHAVAAAPAGKAARPGA
ncbi:NUDIX domain-containing protein [Microbacter sp. GSS18]|nr:NUDIX domain-containing protein [Microbacter sp. GSS18]